MIHIKHYIEIFQMGFSAMINATDKKKYNMQSARGARGYFIMGRRGKKTRRGRGRDD
jgi:nucleoid-associated protein YejK